MSGSLNGNSASSGGAAGAGSGDDFFDQMLNSLPSAWPDLGTPKSPWDMSTNPAASGEDYDESALLANRLRQHQIGSSGAAAGAAGAKPMMQLHQMLMASAGRAGGGGGGGGGDPSGGFFPLPLSLGRDDVEAAFKSPNGTTTGAEGLYNGFGGGLAGAGQAATQPPNFHHAQQGGGAAMAGPAQSFGGAAANGGAQAQSQSNAAAPPRQRVRARRGQATDPHSIAERLRRERIAERMKALQELVPNANKTDKASMLDEIIDYVKFLQLQVKVLSMSRLGGAAAVAPLVANMSSESQGGGGGSNSNGNGAGGSESSLTVTEQQVAKLMEEDMGSAMQYLQGKGLCLMPISLASAISSATCHPRPPPASHLVGGLAGGAAAAVAHLIQAGGPHTQSNNNNNNNHNHANNPDGPSSPNLSVLTAQSAMANGNAESHKDSSSA